MRQLQLPGQEDPGANVGEDGKALHVGGKPTPSCGSRGTLRSNIPHLTANPCPCISALATRPEYLCCVHIAMDDGVGVQVLQGVCQLESPPPHRVNMRGPVGLHVPTENTTGTRDGTGQEVNATGTCQP